MSDDNKSATLGGSLLFLIVATICYFCWHGTKTITTITIAEIVITFWIAFAITLGVLGIVFLIIIILGALS